MENNKIIVKNVIKRSIAKKAGIENGDVILKINGEDVHNTIEYKFLTSDEHLDIIICKANGEYRNISVDKGFYQDIGIEFDDPALDMPKRCSNKCIFCFIDQLPAGMRESLYFKDDDSMLSFFQGNFITFTNMKKEDIDRIIKYRISPINVSVHTTNPELRVKMLNNKRAAEIMDILKTLADGGISLNCQIVLCPGINDGDELVKTALDLYSLYPSISNVAVVPIGLTRFREGLSNVNGYNRDSAKQVIDLLKPLQQKFAEETGEVFIRLADEFYVVSGEPVPEYEHYGDFEQLEDGIGMLRYFDSCIDEALENENADLDKKEAGFITGTSAYEHIARAVKKIEQKLNVKINVYPVVNDFFGSTITVSGLLTGHDIIAQLKGKIKEKTVFIPSNMLRSGETVLLDDMTVEDISRELGTRIVPVRYSGEDTIENIVNEVI